MSLFMPKFKRAENSSHAWRARPSEMAGPTTTHDHDHDHDQDQHQVDSVAAAEFKWRRRRRRRRRRWRFGRHLALLLAGACFVQLAASSAIPFAQPSRPLGTPVPPARDAGHSPPVTALTEKTTTFTWTTTTTKLMMSAGGQPIGRLERDTADERVMIDRSNGSSPGGARQQPGPAMDLQQQEAANRQRLAELTQKFVNNRAINDTAYYVLLLVYSALIGFGFVSNLLICLMVSRSSQDRGSNLASQSN